MYFKILKKDLKRKKTMNIILLMFIILSTMFIASSMKNILSITNALDYYFEQAGMPDYLAATIDKVGSPDISETFDELDAIEDYGIETILYMNSDNLYYGGEQIKTMNNSSVLVAMEDTEIRFFDNNNQVIEEVRPGQVYISGKRMKAGNMEIGDTLEIRYGDISRTFEIAGSFKDAFLGSEMMGMTRFIVSESDFEYFYSKEEITGLYGGSLCYVNTSDTEAVDRALSEQDCSLVFNDTVEKVKMTYVLEMLVAGVLLVISVCLILVALVVLRFTISFTLTEEYREIGVMKAIGIGNIKIRCLYITKYLVLAVIGALLGFLGSIPLGKMMLKQVSSNMVMENENGILINAICSFMVICIILLFSFGCTGKVNKFTPVDAIRSGETGERFRKKGILRLHKSSMRPSLYLAANDVLSSPRRFATVILTFTICLSAILILVNAVNTLESAELVTAFGLTQSDVYMSDEGTQMSFMVENGRELLENHLAEMEETLAENGMPAECVNEVMMKYTVKHGELVCKCQVLLGIGTTADEYLYFKGTAPQNADEIAITQVTAEKLDAQIGDTIVIRRMGQEKEYVITAFFQNMNNMGEGIRLHEDEEVNFLETGGFFGYQINFTDNADGKELQNRIEKIKEIYGTDKVYTAGEYSKILTSVGDVIDGVRIMVLIVMSIVICLITILMERSFIAKERSEIAILKAMGFDDRTVVAWHTLRFGMISILSTVISLLLLWPLTNFSIGPVFRWMGADFGIKYEIVPLEVYVIYPLLVLAVTMISAFLTAHCTKSISPAESSYIE